MELEKNKKTLSVVIGIAAIVIVVILIYFLFLKGKPEEPPVVTEIIKGKPEKAQVEEEETPIEVEQVKPSIQWDSVELDKSDIPIREAAKGISSNPQAETWLKKPNLVRKFVGATDNIVEGLSPRSFLSFLAPKGRFEVYEKYSSLYLDPNCYKRYNRLADVIASLSAQESIRLYRNLKPLIQDAYKQLGYPNKDFANTLQLAVIELLETPVVEGDIMLIRKIISYKMVDSKLENLSTAQKHLLRMGPRNIRKIQTKLREIARELSIPESQIPKPRVYVPSNR